MRASLLVAMSLLSLAACDRVFGLVPSAVDRDAAGDDAAGSDSGSDADSNSCPEWFDVQPGPVVAGTIVGIAAADLNGDSMMDLAAVVKEGPGSLKLHVYLYSAAGAGFVDTDQMDVSPGSTEVVAGNYQEDVFGQLGTSEIAVLDPTMLKFDFYGFTTGLVYIGPITGTQTMPASAILADIDAPSSPLPHFAELAWVARGSNAYVLHDSHDSNRDVSSGVSSPIDLAMLDTDNDGTLEPVITQPTGVNIGAAPTQAFSYADATAIAGGHVGALRPTIALTRGGAIDIFDKPAGAGASFGPHGALQAGASFTVKSLTFMDLDNDDSQELVALSVSTSAPLGHATIFTAQNDSLVIVHTVDVEGKLIASTAADFDGDGKLDLAIAIPQRVSVLHNCR